MRLVPGVMQSVSTGAGCLEDSISVEHRAYLKQHVQEEVVSAVTCERVDEPKYL